MIAVEFPVTVTNGTIEIPEAYRGEFQEAVKVILLAEQPPTRSGKISELWRAR